MRIAGRLAVVLIVAALGAGCAGSSASRVGANWGTAVPDNLDPMIAHPDGTPPERDPGVNTDGETAEAVMLRLRASQQSTPGPEPQTINIGVVGAETGTPKP